MKFKEFRNSEFIKKVLGKKEYRDNSWHTQWEYGERDGIISNGEKVSFKSYWNNGKQSSSKTFKLDKADDFDVSLIRHTTMHRGLSTSNYLIVIKDNNGRKITDFLIPNRALNKEGKLNNTYEFNVIQKGPWYDENFKEVKSEEPVDEQINLNNNILREQILNLAKIK